MQLTYISSYRLNLKANSEKIKPIRKYKKTRMTTLKKKFIKLDDQTNIDNIH